MFPLHYLWLAAAICAEVAGSAFLVKSEQFSRVVPSVLVIVFYGFAFYGLAQALKSMPLGFAYAIWAGLGIVGLCSGCEGIGVQALWGIRMLRDHGRVMVCMFARGTGGASGSFQIG